MPAVRYRRCPNPRELTRSPTIGPSVRNQNPCTRLVVLGHPRRGNRVPMYLSRPLRPSHCLRIDVFCRFRTHVVHDVKGGRELLLVQQRRRCLTPCYAVLIDQIDCRGDLAKRNISMKRSPNVHVDMEMGTIRNIISQQAFLSSLISKLYSRHTSLDMTDKRYELCLRRDIGVSSFSQVFIEGCIAQVVAIKGVECLIMRRGEIGASHKLSLPSRRFNSPQYHRRVHKEIPIQIL